MDRNGSVGIYVAAIASVIVGASILPRLDFGTPIQVVGAILGILAFSGLLVAIGLIRDRRAAGNPRG